MGIISTLLEGIIFTLRLHTLKESLQGLEVKWKRLQAKVIAKGAGKNWNKLEEYYTSNHFKMVKENPWNEWAIEKFLGIPITLPESTYGDTADQDACKKSIDELTELINKLNTAFRNLGKRNDQRILKEKN